MKSGVEGDRKKKTIIKNDRNEGRSEEKKTERERERERVYTHTHTY